MTERRPGRERTCAKRDLTERRTALLRIGSPPLRAQAVSVAGQIGADAVEGRGEARPDRVDRADDHHRDERGDEAVFDGSRSASVAEKLLDEAGSLLEKPKNRKSNDGISPPAAAWQLP